MKQVLRQNLQQKMTPQQILLMKLIQLPATELENRLKKEMEENPVLEERDTFSETDVSESDESDLDDHEPGKDEIDLDYFNDDDDIPGPTRQSTEPKEKFFSLSSKETFQEDLMEQISMKISGEPHLTIARFLIGSLDDSGYLRRDMQSIVDDLAFTQHAEVSLDQVEAILEHLQKLEPAGVGARDLREALLLQLKRKDPNDLLIKNAIYIVENLFEDLSHRRYEKIVERTNISQEDLKEVLEEIKSLNPKPADSETEMEEMASTIEPDFTVMPDGEDLNISLNKGNTPDLNINREYLDMIDSYDKSKNKEDRKTAKFIKEKVDSAQWFIEALKQRDDTLMRVMKTIVSLQREFFHHGDFKLLRPMILKDVAEIVDMDISTISRVVNSKYVQTQFGIFSLKKFFSEGLVMEDGEEVSTNQVKLVLQEIVEEEDKQNPIKDDELTVALRAKGYPIARRTVAKYREQMGIPVARLRRKI